MAANDSVVAILTMTARHQIVAGRYENLARAASGNNPAMNP
jgi:hypothetical protein